MTAYDYPTARLLDESGIDIVLVGDSVGMVVLGYEDTTYVTLAEMLHHTRAVARAVKRAFLVVDFPIRTYDTPEQAVATARDLVGAGAHAVKLEGGATQGIGQALHEQFVYASDSGQAITASFMDYTLPRADDLCNFDMRMDESVPCSNNALGVKGVGELGTIGATPAVVNAVVDALSRAGLGDDVYALQMPLTSERIWQALQNSAIQRNT